MFGFGSAGAEQAIKDENDRVNYSLGYQIGGDFKRQGVELKPELVVKGIQDALSGAKPLMNSQEMRTTLVDLKRKIEREEREKRRQALAKNRAEGEAFLAENARKEGVKTQPSGLQYKVLQEGSGATPKASDTVRVHYRGTLIDGTEFDSSYSRGQPATFRADRVIAGWKEALQLMKEGAKWQLFIPAQLAYGERGAGAKIPPNSTLIFEVELLAIEKSASGQAGEGS
ncbi:MAG: FKBP-type peptidyl-prolyl cis-trans isomerase [Desulfobacterales bacterium]|nr:MAG: FKBP-type peptidyl-prolyl cis-trans isomerase [Desulfobacterales bacterium]